MVIKAYQTVWASARFYTLCIAGLDFRVLVPTKRSSFACCRNKGSNGFILGWHRVYFSVSYHAVSA